MALGSWTAFLAAYLLGGITFIPCLLIALFVYSYFAFPHRSDLGSPGQHGQDDILLPGDDTASLDVARAEVKPPSQDVDVTSGYFAVYREYNPAGINAKPAERPAPVASTTIASPSPSVYQTMYRSIFDRKPAAGPLDTNNNNRMGQRPKKAGNIFYVVLRHGHLMLFDDEEQLEVRHVISLALHDISIYSGEDVTPEGELFIKRNAICLSRRHDASPTPSSASTSDRHPEGQVSKPFYMFSENCSAKEDFYFALLKNQQQAFGFDNQGPTPKRFELKSIISLVQKLHSSEDQVNSRWLNALIGRLFLGVYKTSDISNLIVEKITKKIARVKKPSFLTNINIRKIETGESAPYFSGLRLKDLTFDGECVVEADVKYNGNFRIEVAATAKIDLGTRFKTREVNLVLAVVLKKLEGHVLFRIKAPPSNRIWFSFQTMPKLEMAIEPIVSTRQITYTVITRQIENRIKEVFAETLVQPFWDDVPFFKTEHKKWRGGIFENDDAVEVSPVAEEIAALAGNVDAVEALDVKQDAEELPPMEKTQSLPVPEAHQPTPPGLTGRKASKVGVLPVATVSSTSVDIPSLAASASSRSPHIVKPSTEPIVGTETAHADLFKPSTSPPDHASNYVAALHIRSQDVSSKSFSPKSPQLPTNRPELPSPSIRSTSWSKESTSIESVNGHGKDDSTPSLKSPTLRRNTTSSAEPPMKEDGTPSLANANPPTQPTFQNQTGSLSRNFLSKHDNANTVAATSTSTEGEPSSQKKNNTLAAVTNAAAQAGQWGWNALKRQREAMRHGDKGGNFDLSQPIGRGQPLPPPGTPLPGPQNGRAKFMPIPSSKNTSQTDMSGTPENEDTENHSRSSTSMPFSNRRRRGNGHQHEESEEQNILVVAAPDDSRPGTPESEDEPNQMEGLTGEPHIRTSPNRTPQKRDAALLPADAKVDQASPSGKSEPSRDETPVVAMPFPAVASMDDDDYSGWMSDINLDEENGHGDETDDGAETDSKVVTNSS